LQTGRRELQRTADVTALFLNGGRILGFRQMQIHSYGGLKTLGEELISWE
jgi:hypothetical protein